MTWVCSWSGGKDSALALQRAHAQRGPGGLLLTMFTEGGERSRSHGLPRVVLDGQANALGLDLVVGSASWDDYTPVFVELLGRLKSERGVDAAVFGDIDLEPHRAWCQRACAQVGIACLHPLWGEQREPLVRACLDSGVEALVVAVQDGVLPPALLGRRLDASLLEELASAGVDLAGEQGEYHTVVVDGPLFRRRLDLVPGQRVLRDGYWFLDVALPDDVASA
jgi:diphthine-ammonia ligase